jgi:hypothetical protein
MKILKKYILFVPIIIVISAFGPYLTNQIRMEHVVLYPLLPLAILHFLSGSTGKKVIHPASTIFLIALFIVIWTSFATLLSPVSAPPSKIISHFENYFQPVSILFLLGIVFYQVQNIDKIIEKVFRVLLRKRCCCCFM